MRRRESARIDGEEREVRREISARSQLNDENTPPCGCAGVTFLSKIILTIVIDLTFHIVYIKLFIQFLYTFSRRIMSPYLIFAIITVIVLLVACVIHYFADSCVDFEDFFVDSYGWVTILCVCAISGIVFGCIFWIWQYTLMIALPIIVLIVACIIHYFVADCIDLQEFFFDEHGWLTILSVCIITAIIFGFIFWTWWIMLIITMSIAIVAGIIICFSYKKNKSTIIEEASIKTGYKCPNCGAALIKFKTTTAFENNKLKCIYCDVIYEKKDLQKNNYHNNEIELTDFEEEYFYACVHLFFRPYNPHSQPIILSRYKKLSEKIKNYDYIYDDEYSDDEEMVLNNAYSFFIDNQHEINEYLEQHDIQTIKEHYELYLYIQESYDDEMMEDD